jgi:hypothetical protein
MAHAELQLALVRIGPATEADAEGIEGDAKKRQDVYEKKWEPVEEEVAHRHLIADER